jgi:hypothetical protein
MSKEKLNIFVPELETALKKGDVQACYKLLALIPNGVNLKIGNLLLELTTSTEDEKELMRRSTEEMREFGLIKTKEKMTTIEGSGNRINLDDIAGPLYQIVSPEKPAIFSHTHWDTDIHPLPSYDNLGFGDVPIFEMFMQEYPLLKCRTIFKNRGTTRSIIYKGKIK